jgi:hypothetical protein
VATYEQARANEFTEAASQKITGIDLSIAEDSPLVQGGRTPIQLCLCVTDPCDCPGPIIWINPDDIHSRASTERSNRAGEDVTEFKIDPDATVLVESVVRAKASALQSHGRRLRLRPSSHFRPPSRGDCGCGGGCGDCVGAGTARDRAGSYYDGQECAGHTLYDVWVEADGLDTVFYYVAVGSC